MINDVQMVFADRVLFRSEINCNNYWREMKL